MDQEVVSFSSSTPDSKWDESGLEPSADWRETMTEPLGSKMTKEQGPIIKLSLPYY